MGRSSLVSEMARLVRSTEGALPMSWITPGARAAARRHDERVINVGLQGRPRAGRGSVCAATGTPVSTTAANCWSKAKPRPGDT